MRGRQTEVALNGHSLHRRLAISLVIAGGLLLLTGCQGLSGSSNSSTVALGSSTLNFGAVVIGTTETLSDTISNNTSSAVTISSIQGLGSGFQVTGITLPLTLTTGQSAPFNVQFQPAAASDPTITISFAGSNAQSIVSLTASGDGVTLGTLSPNPASIAFGNTNFGSNRTSTVSLSNIGGTSLTITQATLSGAGFSMSNLSLPLTLNPQGAASVTITFAPTGAGNFSGGVTFATTADGVGNSVPLNFSGVGVVSGTLAPTFSSMAFGNIQVGGNSSQSETLTNTGGATVTISQAAPSGPGFSISGLNPPVTLAINQSVTFNAIFAPTTAGPASGALSIVSDASNSPLSIPLSGTGLAPGALTPNPTSLAFGSVQDGTSSSLSETLTNTGGSSLTISAATASGTGFSLSGLTVPVTLTAGQSVTFTATFTPTSAGAASGSLSVVSNGSNSPLNIALSGTGTAAGTLAVSPTSLSFGSVTVGSSSPLSGSLTASGASVTVQPASPSNSEFVLSGISLPVTLGAGQSATFTVTFTPQASGAASASLSFSSNASNSPAVQTMTGTGTTATQHTVDLTWTASADAVGYNIYRGTVSGGPYTMINTSLDGTTAYTDSTVVSGDTFNYVAPAVNCSWEVSGYTNKPTAVIPTP